jgi:Lrp/AsnC family transcriptional regulator for asnA, asnC and gidA
VAVKEKIDSINLKMLDILHKDARTPFTEIAKQLDISPAIASARFNKMKQTGVIKGTTLILDMTKTNIAYYVSIGVKASEPEVEKVVSFINELGIEETQVMAWVTFGRYNVTALLSSKKLVDAHRIKQAIKQNPDVIEVSTSLNISSDMNSFQGLKPNVKMGLMDEVDLELIRILCKDARVSFKGIGQKLGVGTDTIFRRYKRLVDEGLIIGLLLFLGSRAWGITGFCGFFVKVKHGSNILAVKEKLRITPQIEFVVQILGEYDFYMEAFFESYDELHDLMTALRSIPELFVIDPVIYSRSNWSMPIFSTFERGVPDWFFDIKR